MWIIWSYFRRKRLIFEARTADLGKTALIRRCFPPLCLVTEWNVSALYLGIMAHWYYYNQFVSHASNLKILTSAIIFCQLLWFPQEACGFLTSTGSKRLNWCEGYLSTIKLTRLRRVRDACTRCRDLKQISLQGRFAKRVVALMVASLDLRL